VDLILQFTVFFPIQPFKFSIRLCTRKIYVLHHHTISSVTYRHSLKLIGGSVIGPNEEVTIRTGRGEQAMTVFINYWWKLTGINVNNKEYHKSGTFHTSGNCKYPTHTYTHTTTHMYTRQTCNDVMLPWWPVNTATGAEVCAHHTLIVYNKLITYQ